MATAALPATQVTQAMQVLMDQAAQAEMAEVQVILALLVIQDFLEMAVAEDFPVVVAMAARLVSLRLRAMQEIQECPTAQVQILATAVAAVSASSQEAMAEPEAEDLRVAQGGLAATVIPALADQEQREETRVRQAIRDLQATPALTEQEPILVMQGVRDLRATQVQPEQEPLGATQEVQVLRATWVPMAQAPVMVRQAIRDLQATPALTE